MYLDYYGFREEPFNITPNSRFLFLSARHREALAALQYGITQRKGFIALTGHIGCGKTTICRALLSQLDRAHTRLALILNPELNDVELLQAINAEFGIESASTSKRELLAALNEFLLAEYREDRTVVLVIDEAQRLGPKALEQVRLLSNLETEDAKLIQIALVGQPELADLLDLPELEQLNQRITVRYHIEPLNFDEVCEYIAHRIDVAAPSRIAVRFHKKALRRIFEYSGGVPRRVNVVCDRALLVTFVQEGTEVSEAAVNKAIEELGGMPRRHQRPSRTSEILARNFTEPEPAPIPAPAPAPAGGMSPALRGAMAMGAVVLLLVVLASAGPAAIGLLRAALAPPPPAATVPAVAPAPTPVPPTPAPPPTPSPTATPLPSPTASATPSATPSSSPSPSPSESPTATASISPTGSATPSPTASPSPSPSVSPSPTDAPTATPSASPSPSESPSPTPSASPSPTPAPSPTPEAGLMMLGNLLDPAAAPTPSALPPPAPQWEYDDHGVMRILTPELTYPAAVLTWLYRSTGNRLPESELARLRSLTDDQVAGLQLTAGRAPLYLREAQLAPMLQGLRADQLPILLQTDRSSPGFGPWTVLVAIGDGMATLHDPRSGRLTLPIDDVEEHVATVKQLFFDREQLTGLRPLDRGARVEALQNRLRRAGVYRVQENSGLFDPITEAAVRAYRERVMLPGGPEIDAALALRLLTDTEERR
jgi:general secretion pathway protein A